MFNFSRFDHIAVDIIKLSEEEANELKAQYVGTEHVLLEILKRKHEYIVNLMGQYGLDYNRFKQALVDVVGTGLYSRVDGNSVGLTRLLEREVYKYMAMMDEHMVSIDVLTIAIISNSGDVTDMVLNNLGFDKREFLKSAVGSLGTNVQQEDGDFSNEDVFRDYTINLNERAKNGLIDPVIGREKEISRMIEILSRRTKNNPTLIGEPGVGKTAVCEGLALKIVQGEVPYYLLEKEIYKVDLAMLVAGTKYRGDFEQRIKNLLEEARKDDSIILFIDEIHNIVGAGGSEGSLDASNIIKPYLERGEIQIIGATTFDEYKKYIEKDSALERRLQTIIVDEPSVDETIKILEGIKEQFETYHRVKITDEALESCAKLSDRYLTERFLPDKAIDVMDEAMSKKRTKTKKSSDADVLRERLDEVSSEKDKAVENEDFLRAAKLRDEERLILKKIEDMPSEELNEENIVDIGIIEEVVSRWSGIPVTKMTDSEVEKLRKFASNLRAKVIGQDEAIKVIDKAIKRSKAGLKDKNRPIGSFLFVGPTGVGKTYLAKRISYELFGDENKMTVLDMSEFMERHSVSKLIGSPPGYVGFEDGGRLTEAVRRNPYQVLLFDEIEKAHPDVFNALLQILEEGRLTDGKGKVVDFKNTVIIMTSNAGTRELKKRNIYGFNEHLDDEKAAISSKVDKALKEMFSPEFLNRIDEIVVFSTLDKDSIKRIIRLEINKISDRIRDRYDIEVTEQFIEHIAENGYSELYGARPIKRALMKNLEDELSEKIVQGDLVVGDSAIVDFVDGKVFVTKK